MMNLHNGEIRTINIQMMKVDNLHTEVMRFFSFLQVIQLAYYGGGGVNRGLTLLKKNY